MWRHSVGMQSGVVQTLAWRSELPACGAVAEVHCSRQARANLLLQNFSSSIRFANHAPNHQLIRKNAIYGTIAQVSAAASRNVPGGSFTAPGSGTLYDRVRRAMPRGTVDGAISTKPVAIFTLVIEQLRVINLSSSFRCCRAHLGALSSNVGCRFDLAHATAGSYAVIECLRQTIGVVNCEFVTLLN